MKVKFNDKFEYETRYGTNPSWICILLKTFDELEELTKIITDPQNLSKIEFYANETVVEQCFDMKLNKPMYQHVNIGDTIEVCISLRRKTELETLLELYQVKEQKISLAMTYLTDEEATTVVDLFPTYESLIGQTIEIGTRLSYKGELYKAANKFVVNDMHKPGDVGTESLYTHIDKAHAGTLEDPIPAKANMEYIKGKYYIEDEKIYLMNREGMKDGETVVLQYVPSQLVGQYFELVEK